MPKAYWMSLRIQIHDTDKMAAYAAEAGPAIAAGGGKFLARGGRAKTLEGYEQGRVVIIEFPDFDTALKTYHSDAYQAAKAHIKGGAVERDTFIVEGIEDPAPRGETDGPVAYWIGAHMTIHDEDKMAAYVAKASEAIKAAGARGLVRGGRVQTMEGFEQTRIALIEHLNWDVAAGYYDSPLYAEARKALDGGCTRDICITEALA
jgi:uncharacterized protein (DUF1330 family)